MSLQPGAKLDDYRIVRPIGRGAYATVYRAEHDGLDSAVAIKVLADNWALDPNARIRFLSEGQMARRVASTHIAAVFDVGETPAGQPYLVYQLAERGDLGVRLARLGKPAAAADLLRIAEALSLSLSAIHAEGIVHRDVKPENLLIAGRGERPNANQLLGNGEQLILSDLGMAKDLAIGSGLTAATGTASYRAAEQEQAGSIIDDRADVHAATAVIAHAACGTRPDDARGWSDIIADSELSQPLRAVLMRGLDPDPDQRPNSMEKWFDEIEDVLAPSEGPTAARSVSFWVVPAALLLIVGSMVGAWWFRGTLIDEGTASINVEADGRLVATAERDGFEVILLGPEQLAVGEPGRYSARVEPDAELVWLTSDGPLDGSETLEVIADEPGIVRIVLIAVPEDERILRVELLTSVSME